ncbi:DUF4234 domain-containing protein [Endozoicomonas sp. SM1973]|uniref:DUF4234 domain-containing protein n=1 Tax=Spartinivicinus marinus TaxID=2994442 RepID=A0A853IFX7_9GAMM|nr:DUF4234 domain-containing protein [Spartinivicinus marinus]MCX4027891.1 DUF4234 domain-containing protein [Spartinivicinus marinus]NYZ69448.1 DUF4234 domain-containing protein [Spartinivicinus marinus]
MSVDQTPYAVPNADLETSSTKIGDFSQLPRFSAWWVFLLSVITFGIYYYIWMYKRTVVINRICDRKIAPWLSNTVISLFIVNTLLSFYVGAVGETVDPAVDLVSLVMTVAATILGLVWIYAIRNRLHEVGNIAKGSKYWIGGILTFFFTSIYLQYKINQVIDDSQ